ncbi:MAG: anti-sigma factor family protein [Planctomycetota bacterium]
MDHPLRQQDFETLSAWVDDELPEAEARRVERLLATDPAWQQARDELESLDEVLDAWQAPAPRGDLAERIIARSRQQTKPPQTPRRVIRWAKWAVPAAAAAAVLIVALAGPWRNGGHATAPEDSQTVTDRRTDQQDPPEAANPQAGKVSPEGVETIAAENVDFFRRYDVVANMETLEAIEELEQERSAGS